MRVRQFAGSIFAAAAVVAIIPSSGLARYDRVAIWHTLVHNSGAFASDCQRCEEDRGIAIICKNGSGQAEIHFNWLESEKARGGNPTDVSIVIDGQKFRRSGILSEPGLLGAFPVIKVTLNDPLLIAMASGREIKAFAEDQEISIPLKGSSKAISRLIKACR